MEANLVSGSGVLWEAKCYSSDILDVKSNLRAKTET